MTNLSATTRLVADDLRQAERSIETAQRDLLAFMLTATDANRALGYSPAVAQPVMKSAAAALAALVEGQGRLAVETHTAALKLARRLGMTEVDYGGGEGKPASEVFTGASLPAGQTVTA
jgi:hypothetical protein